jgi:hypothetical protein
LRRRQRNRRIRTERRRAAVGQEVHKHVLARAIATLEMAEDSVRASRPQDVTATPSRAGARVGAGARANVRIQQAETLAASAKARSRIDRDYETLTAPAKEPPLNERPQYSPSSDSDSD